MAIEAFPSISQSDYESFRRLLGSHLPDTYDKWLQFLDEKRNDIISTGHTVSFVNVKADKFAAFCSASGTPKDLQGLRYFASQML